MRAFILLLSLTYAFGGHVKRGILDSFDANHGLLLADNSVGSSLDFSAFDLSGGFDLLGFGDGFFGSFAFDLPPPIVAHHQPVQTTHSFSHSKEYVGVPAPYPVPFAVTRRIPVKVPHPYPVEVPQPHPVPVPHPVPIEVPKPVPVPVSKAVPVQVPEPVPVPVPRTEHVPVPHPFPVEVPKPVPVHVPQPVPVPVPKPIHPTIIHQENHPVFHSLPPVFEHSSPFGFSSSGGDFSSLKAALHGLS